MSRLGTRRSSAHMDHMDAKGYESEFHDGLVHEPMSIKVAMNISQARRSRRFRMKQSSIARGTCETSPDVQWKSCAPGGQRQGRQWIQGSIRRTRCISFTVGSGKGFWIHPGMAGEAHEAVSAHTPVRMSEAHGLLRSTEKA